MAKNAPTPSNSISFSEKHRPYWRELILNDPALSQRETLIAVTMSENIRYQHGYSGWLLQSGYGYVTKKLGSAGVKVDKKEVAETLFKLIDLGYLSKFKLGKTNDYYFTDPSK